MRCNVRLRIVCILSSGFKSPEKIFLVCKTCWSNDGCRHNSNNIGELGKYVRHFLKLLLLSLYFYRLKRPNSSNFYHPTFFGISRNANETFWKARSINIMKQYKEFLFFCYASRNLSFCLNFFWILWIIKGICKQGVQKQKGNIFDNWHVISNRNDTNGTPWSEKPQDVVEVILYSLYELLNVNR